jgi:group I intron endonuclease
VGRGEGFSKFSLEILEYCNIEDLLKREQYYIDLLKPEYNICKIAGSPLGRIVSEATRAKLRIANTGYKHTKEALEKISIASPPPALLQGGVIGQRNRENDSLQLMEER